MSTTVDGALPTCRAGNLTSPTCCMTALLWLQGSGLRGTSEMAEWHAHFREWRGVMEPLHQASLSALKSACMRSPL